MTAQGRDRLAGTILLVFAGLWCWGAVVMIPTGIGSGPVGPRGFPLGLGLLLAALSAMLVASSFARPRNADAEEPEAGQLGVELWAVSSALAILVGYAALLYAAGFIIATAVTVVLALVLVLGKRDWRLIGGLSLGTALGGYVIFNKILGVYLPHGRWLDLWL